MAPIGKYALCVVVLLSVGVAVGQDYGGGRGGRNGRRGPRGPMTAEQIAQRVSRMEDMLKSLDTNHNGMIDADEVSGLPQRMVDGMMKRMKQNGVEPKFPIPISTITQAMERSMRQRAAKASSGAPPKAAVTRKTATSRPPAAAASSAPPAVAPSGTTTPVAGSPAAKPNSPAGSSTAAAGDAKKPVRKSGRFLTPQERFPGLPKWFLDKDLDGDGQVTMAEFATEWTPELLDQFNRYDLNHDGIITAAECLKVEKPSNPSAK